MFAPPRHAPGEPVFDADAPAIDAPAGSGEEREKQRHPSPRSSTMVVYPPRAIARIAPIRPASPASVRLRAGSGATRNGGSASRRDSPRPIPARSGRPWGFPGEPRALRSAGVVWLHDEDPRGARAPKPRRGWLPARPTRSEIEQVLVHRATCATQSFWAVPRRQDHRSATARPARASLSRAAGSRNRSTSVAGRRRLPSG